MEDKFDLIRWLTTERDKGTIVWLFNIGAEKVWHLASAGVIDRSEDRLVNRVEEMNLLLCREQDILLLREMPDGTFLNRLREWGICIPQIRIPKLADPYTPIAELVLRDEPIKQELSRLAEEREDVYFVPYAVTALEESFAQTCGLRLPSASSSLNAAVNDKIFNRKAAEELGYPVCKGRICNSAAEISQAWRELTAEPPFFAKVIIKEPHGASGKGLYIVDSESKLNTLLARFKRLSRQGGEGQWLVEGWYEKEADVNFQVCISPAGSVDVFSVKEQILKETVYIGSKIPAALDDSILNKYRAYGQEIGDYLFRLGFTGVAGIDSIIAADGTIIPIVEINGRFTLSTYISFLDRVLGERKIFSRYFKILSESPLGYDELCGALDAEGILYRPDRGEGVLVYTSGTLPMTYDENCRAYPGRLFTLVAARDWHAVDRYNHRLEAFVASLSETRPAQARA